MADRFVILSTVIVWIAKDFRNDRTGGFQGVSPLSVKDCLSEAALHRQKVTVPMVGPMVSRIEIEGKLENSLGTLEVVISKEFRIGERRVRFGVVCVEPYRFLCPPQCLPPALIGRHFRVVMVN